MTKVPRADINLALTTPPMHGKQVKNAQWLLSHNRYKIDFDPGQHDGQYGPHTAAATRRAKYLLGYPKRRVNGNFGPELYGYLVPKDDKFALIRPKSYQARGAIRQKLYARKQRKLEGHRIRAVNLALAQVGVKEYPPNSNRVLYSTWYGLIGPWCAMFVSWCFSKVGRSLRYASVQSVYDDARAHRNGLDLVGTPIRGDLAIVENIGHIGIFLEPDGSSYFKYVSGNTGGGSEADGGEVAVHTLPRSYVNAWVRVTG